MFIIMKRSLSIIYIRVKYDIEVLSLQMMFFSFQVTMDIISNDEDKILFLYLVILLKI